MSAAKMSSFQHPSEVKNEQLIPDEETLYDFKEIIVKTEEEIDEWRRQLNFNRAPLIILHRIDHPEKSACEEEGVLTEISNQKGESTLVQKDPNPLQIKLEQDEREHQQFKEEQKQLRISNNEEYLVLKQETNEVLVIPSNVLQNPIETELNSNRVISLASLKVENQDQEGSSSKDLSKTRDGEQKQYDRCLKTREQKDTADSTKAKTQLKTPPDQNIQTGQICDKITSQNSHSKTHITTVTAEKPFLCTTCGKSYSRKSVLRRHVKSHSNEKPFTCTTCGKGYNERSGLAYHVKTHTGVNLLTNGIWLPSHWQKKLDLTPSWKAVASVPHRCMSGDTMV
ncbi:zinc finger protein 182-like isoform X2 [Cyprinodon tularosa]|uniref:zinc finger protein 182-like isoform X2 n=1 Tax=Cyprinodon tularosa TaxID=77115 RepID=UPI0018E27A7F|nr:zinc finger protein 182-like isoform X2 [Cyprinodon tularosa]